MKGDNLNKEKNLTIQSSKKCSCPFDLLKQIILRAKPNTNFPFAMTVSTSDPETGHISSRVLSLRALFPDSLIFQAVITDFETQKMSTKGIQLSKNPYVAINFWFDSLGTQISMSGPVWTLKEDELQNLDRSYDAEILDCQALLQKKVQPGFQTFLFKPDWIQYLLHNKVCDSNFFVVNGLTENKWSWNWKRWSLI